MKLAVIESIVNCGTCNQCCRGEAIYIHEECGDDPSQYILEQYHDGRTILAHKENGDCIYLDREKGCTIHARRPAICREFDCRTFLQKVGKRNIKKMGLQRIEYAARRLKKNGVGSCEKE